MAAWITGPVAERCPNAELLPRPVPRRPAGDRGARRDPPRGLERGTPARPDRSSPASSRAPASRSGRTPRTSPPAKQLKLARIEQTNRPLFRAYLLKEQLRQIYRLPAAQAAELLDALAELGPTMPPAAVRQARQDDHRPEARDPRRDHQRALQRPRRSDQHPDPTDHPTRASASTPPKRSSPSRCSHSPASAHPYPDETTHGNFRRFPKSPASCATGGFRLSR